VYIDSRNERTTSGTVPDFDTSHSVVTAADKSSPQDLDIPPLDDPPAYFIYHYSNVLCVCYRAVDVGIVAATVEHFHRHPTGVTVDRSCRG